MSSLVSKLRGPLEATGPDWVEVSLNGLTLRLSVPAGSSDRLGDVGAQVLLFTSLQVREDNITLYGFVTEEARSIFEVLIGVNGVGPRVALSVLSRLSPDSLIQAISAGDTDAFIGISGVGKKIASRIVLELKGKLEGAWSVPDASDRDADVIDALVALGYSSAEAKQAVSVLPLIESESLEERVLEALRRIGGE